ncbi:acyl carrier protein [Streptomyces sp. DSM 118878]
MTAPADRLARETLAAWLAECVAAHVRMAPEDIKPAEPMSSYGLDSIGATSLLVQIEERVGHELDANVPWEYPTIDALTDFVLQLESQDSASGRIGAV